MKKVIFSALVALVAGGGAFATQAKQTTTSSINPYFLKPGCEEINCSAVPSGTLCNTLTLYQNCEDTEPVSPVDGYVIQN